MKSTFIVRIWRFLEDHIAVILLSFIPVCLGIVFALGGILCLLPSGIAARLSPSSMEMMLTALGALVVCAIIAILRMIRDITAGKPWRLRRPAIIRTLARFILYLLLLAMDSYFVWRTVLPLGELQLKEERIQTQDNLIFVYKRMERYHTEHGAYPPQQDMKSLMNTLGMNKSDFKKTQFFDISSAEYHASNRNQEYSAQNMDDPVLSIRVKSRIFGKYERLCVRKDGSMYYRDFETGAKL